jgi:hypothetical protein
MIDAVVQNPEIRRLACGEPAMHDGRLLVDVRIEPPLREPCPNAVFASYSDGQAVDTDALLQLYFSALTSDTWAVVVGVVVPPNSPDDSKLGDGFDDTAYYCHLIGVRVTGTEQGWRAWQDRR